MSAIKADWIDQFEKKTPQMNENYGITYDFGSIMHYGGTRFVEHGQVSGVHCALTQRLLQMPLPWRLRWTVL
ncbi:hypothetical protein Y032_0638g962 [Ancylostoma ceylanicum]|uniref:Peptidase M12A domain-containing protein n=1 Tax=Ancylostoma ceylanicum TaxID=53326 RepID=A0A016WJQ4_9BILA|nr:hypothetical protein Y032_0638g962 [Ancylostoma ceylanicum]